LERLHQGGLRPDLDLPGFLRHGTGASGDRNRLVRDHLIAIRDRAIAWAGRGHMVAPNTGVLADLVFAHGMARLGDRDRASSLLGEAREATRDRDAVMILLFGAFEHRVAQALEGKPNAGPLPSDLMNRLDRMGKDGGEDERKREKEARYKIDRLREHSRILEPLERINPYRHWVGAQAEELTRELGAWPDLADRNELAARVARALAAKRSGPDAGLIRARVLREALEVAFRLGEAMAQGMLEAVLPVADEITDPPARPTSWRRGSGWPPITTARRRSDPSSPGLPGSWKRGGRGPHRAWSRCSASASGGSGSSGCATSPMGSSAKSPGRSSWAATWPPRGRGRALRRSSGPGRSS